MKRRASLFCLLMTAAAADVFALEPNLLGGYGVIGPDQYDQGKIRAVITVNLAGLVELGSSWSLGGVGVVSRTNPHLHWRFDEFALAAPFVTYRRGRARAQVGAGIQRLNLMKNFYYLTVGIGLGRRRAAELSVRSKRYRSDSDIVMRLRPSAFER
jgi:hypothetical protein